MSAHNATLIHRAGTSQAYCHDDAELLGDPSSEGEAEYEAWAHRYDTGRRRAA